MRFRRKYIVNPFQTRLLLVGFGYFLFLVGALAVTVVMPLNAQLQDTDLPIEVRSQVADQLIYLHAHVWPFLIGIALLVGVHSLLVSHRIAGPLVRLRSVMTSIRDGRIPTRVRLRRADLLHPEAELLEQMAVALIDRVSSAKSVLAELDACVRELESSKSSPRSACRLRARLDELSAVLEALDATPPQDPGLAQEDSQEARWSA